ncbi:hypothetical protein KO527_15515 [Pseudoalteromonas sp. C2R02]|uniref:hypothetical protein n=1 Tax=Pseudoalteromonas sp. C2R02 TaxID=2841565 RepID=UPI001C091F6F|nr:hypothetical protein [Pseudoalteromonas sp. C2R02]MBU2970759.1 hypothetical protein [Pseudoalteromonas sp. C2R02]
MKLFYIFSIAIFCSLTLGCNAESKLVGVESKAYFNDGEFVGLMNLGDTITNTELDYSLDLSAGGELRSNTCTDVNNANDATIEPSQYHLVRLMKVNCIAAEHFIKAKHIKSVLSYLPEKITVNFIQSLPLSAVPDLGGSSLQDKKGLLITDDNDFKILTVNEGSIEVAISGGLVVNYLVMAKGDFDKDGFEDVLLRLDWYVDTAFGKGFDLLMVSKSSEKESPVVTWRM